MNKMKIQISCTLHESTADQKILFATIQIFIQFIINDLVASCTCIPVADSLHDRSLIARCGVYILLCEWKRQISMSLKSGRVGEPTSSVSMACSLDSSLAVAAADSSVGAPDAVAALAPAADGALLLLRRRGSVMNFGSGRASRSSETLVAAWRASMRSITPRSS